MKRYIPNPMIEFLSYKIAFVATYSQIKELFIFAGAPSHDSDEISLCKYLAVRLKKINEFSNEPLQVLGKIIECYMESSLLQNIFIKAEIERILNQFNMSYIPGGFISDNSSLASKSLAKFIKDRDLPAIENEFSRALSNAVLKPKEAISAACNLIESICKIYIADEKLESPKKQDLKGLWKVVGGDLGFNNDSLEDNDLKKILVGIASIIDGISSFRTHASSAHGEGRKRYIPLPRHARFVINSSHSISLFILETWHERKEKVAKY